MFFKKTIFEFIILLKRVKPQEYFFFALTLFWLVFDLLYLKETKLIFVFILIGTHGIIYAAWLTGKLNNIFGIAFLMLFISTVYLVKVTIFRLIFVTVYGLLTFLVIRYQSAEIEAIENYWMKKASSLYCYKETMTLLSVILMCLLFMVGETLLTTPKFYELWVALVTYTVMGSLISSTLNLFFIIKCPNLSHKVFHIILGIVSILLTILTVFLGLHIACTSPGFCPPNLPGIGAYQELAIGYRASTVEQLLVGRIYSLCHIGEIPPLMEGTMEVDLQRTLKLLMPLSNINKLYVNIIVEGMTGAFPFTKQAFLNFIEGVGVYDITELK